MVAIVGVCASGKTTLSAGLNQNGVKAYSVPQEHSSVRRLWEKQHPDVNFLVVLDAQWETTKQRRPTISYGPDRLEDQRQRLVLARECCNLYLPTDGLGIDEVRQRVLESLESWKERV